MDTARTLIHDDADVPPNHPDRLALADEVHARPPEPVADAGARQLRGGADRRRRPRARAGAPGRAVPAPWRRAAGRRGHALPLRHRPPCA
ncbi:MAG: hypothetical protein MZW92_70795 [Comamonadaceae bacterium]|nr:hypothetical protein [Comamonadaceae bacterium]